jgi:hypothetical protein
MTNGKIPLNGYCTEGQYGYSYRHSLKKKKKYLYAFSYDILTISAGVIKTLYNNNGSHFIKG